MVIEKYLGTMIGIRSDGIVFEQVKQYKYLGTIFTKEMSRLQEIKMRIARKSFWDLKDIMINNIDMKPKKDQ